MIKDTLWFDWISLEVLELGRFTKLSSRSYEALMPTFQGAHEVAAVRSVGDASGGGAAAAVRWRHRRRRVLPAPRQCWVDAAAGAVRAAARQSPTDTQMDPAKRLSPHFKYRKLWYRSSLSTNYKPQQCALKERWWKQKNSISNTTAPNISIHKLKTHLISINYFTSRYLCKTGVKANSLHKITFLFKIGAPYSLSVTFKVGLIIFFVVLSSGRQG